MNKLKNATRPAQLTPTSRTAKEKPVSETRRPEGGSRPSGGESQDRVRFSRESQEDDSENRGGFQSLLAGLESNFGRAGDEEGGVKIPFGGSASGQPAEPRDPQEVALESFEEFFDVLDNPGGGGLDGVVSGNDLRRIAEGDFNEDRARERLLAAGVDESDLDDVLAEIRDNASFLLEQEETLQQIDVASGRGSVDGRISRGDLTAFQLEQQRRAIENGEELEVERRGLPRGDEFQVPSQTGEQDGLVEAGEDNRTDELIRQQEQAILEALGGDGQLSFTNAQGETEALQISQVRDSDGMVRFELEGEDGHRLEISSELNADDTRTALARLADYYTQVPAGLRDSVEEFILRSGESESGNAGAAFFPDDHSIEFFDGLRNVDEQFFDHELAHAVAVAQGNEDAVPEGWEQVIERDGGRGVSEYAEATPGEDFAESWATYTEARDRGPAALDLFRERFPERYALLEEIFENAA